MYQWLTDALQGPSTVISANRRLARVLREAFTEQQLQSGKLAWQSPAIYSWQDWLEKLTLSASDQDALPTRINQHQSQLLWERCLNKEIGATVSGLASLVRLSGDTWQRLADWRVSIREVAAAARSDDQRLFAAAAGHYLGILERENWVDDAGLGLLVEDLIRTGRSIIMANVTFVGFDRERPVLASIKAMLAKQGCAVHSAPSPDVAASVCLQSFATVDAELRAAGAWAREQLEENPDHNIAIVAGKLEQQADQKTRLVRDGLVPGWQYAPPSVAHSVNVSYGRKLKDFPAVAIALLLLHWLVRDLSSIEAGQLLRTPLLGAALMGGRSRLELRLRQLPDRGWAPAMLSAELRGDDETGDTNEWQGLVAAITKLRRELPRSASPAGWAVYIDATLKDFQWPGTETLSSFDFQLVNRWRELLNDLARLELVSPRMNLESAILRLESMAADTVFQPESENRAVQLLGPLEASGAEFDALWISGLSATHWPPAGNPSPLISRQLQRRKGMPDAEPADTIQYAERLLLRLGKAAHKVVCSYALTEDDAEQTPTDLIERLHARAETVQSDPGWHAATMSTTGRTVVVGDAVPKLSQDEKVLGGAGTIQRQLVDPISAFVSGRLGVRILQPQAVGLPAALRGNIIHDALYRLYLDTPSSADIATWSETELGVRIKRAIDGAFTRHERNTDDVLAELFAMERSRIARLLQHFVKVDHARGEFSIGFIEREVAFVESDVRLQLRVDRIDCLPDGTLAILDYKTGATKRFLQSNGQPREIQLVAYACALNEPISAMALVNIDTREVSFDGAGRGYTDTDGWQDSLDDWKKSVAIACETLGRGDVRINALQGMKEARGLNLISRYTELRRDG